MPVKETVERRREDRKKTEPHALKLQVKDGMGAPRWINAELLNVAPRGIGIALALRLPLEFRLLVRGNWADNGIDAVTGATVKWCAEANGKFHAGLELEEGTSSEAQHAADGHHDAAGELDCYEIMQLSPNADPETIVRVYRIMAQRYHPDSPAGSQEMFLRLGEAYRILSDPAQRAQYDARRQNVKRTHWQIFNRPELSTRQDEEKRKRRAILEALYAKAIHDPGRARMNLLELESLLGCPREHMEAALWYLKGKSFLKGADDGSVGITVAGVDALEGNEHPSETHDQKLLTHTPGLEPF